MARPAVSTFGEEIYDALGPFADGDEDNGWPLLQWCEGLAQMFAQIEMLGRDTDTGDPGWSVAVDLDRAPSYGLGWLGQMVGVQLLVGLDDAAQRDRIVSTSGRNRGTPAAIRGAARQFLTGTQRVDLTERDGGDAYHFHVRTFVAETPDSAAVYAAILAEKPAGLNFVYEVATGMTYSELDTTYGTYAAMTAAAGTYGDVAAGVPPP